MPPGSVNGYLYRVLPVLIILFEQRRGCSSVVERHVANVNVEGSNPFTRFRKDLTGQHL